MFDLYDIGTLAGMLASLAVVYLFLEAASVALPALAARASRWLNTEDDTVAWAHCPIDASPSGVAPASGRKLHASSAHPFMNNRPIRQAA